MKREHWEQRRAMWSRALQEIARKLPPQSTLREMLGSVAWGRYDGEPTPTDTKDNVVFGAGYLEGVRHTALLAGRALNLKGTSELERIHDRFRREQKR